MTKVSELSYTCGPKAGDFVQAEITKEMGFVGTLESETNTVQSNYAQHRVLVADDQESMTTLVHRLVSSRLGCQVSVAQNGDEALQCLSEEPVDVFITDMMMPGIHGAELVKQAKTLCPEIDIIVMTGYGTNFPFVEVINAGACDFLNKPFPHAELEAKLIRIFRERELTKQWKLAESKYRSLFELSADGMVVLEDANHRIVDANPAFRELCGLEMTALGGKPIYELCEDTDRMRLEQWLGICVRSGGGTMADLMLVRSDGKHKHLDVTSTFIEAGSERIVFLSFKDVTEKREIESRLAEAAQKDELTGLYNKRSFQNRIEWTVENARKQGDPLALVFIDLDNFKRCNDTHGHPVGDILLRCVGEVITKSIRVKTLDEGFRCGGDEFAIILQGANEEASARVAQRMQNLFANIENYGTTLSIGVVQYQKSMSVSAFIERADQALYQAKGQGKNQVVMA